jgi:hypothetical protein
MQANWTNFQFILNDSQSEFGIGVRNTLKMIRCFALKRHLKLTCNHSQLEGV